MATATRPLSRFTSFTSKASRIARSSSTTGSRRAGHPARGAAALTAKRFDSPGATRQ
jgi:hypothetical protein